MIPPPDAPPPDTPPAAAAAEEEQRSMLTPAQRRRVEAAEREKERRLGALRMGLVDWLREQQAELAAQAGGEMPEGMSKAEQIKWRRQQAAAAAEGSALGELMQDPDMQPETLGRPNDCWLASVLSRDE